MCLYHHNYYIVSIFLYIVFYRYLFPFLSSDYRHKILLDEVGIIRNTFLFILPIFIIIHQFGNTYDFGGEKAFLYDIDLIVITFITKVRATDIDSKPQLMILENYRWVRSQPDCHISHRIMFVY